MNVLEQFRLLDSKAKDYYHEHEEEIKRLVKEEQGKEIAEMEKLRATLIPEVKKTEFGTMIIDPLLPKGTLIIRSQSDQVTIINIGIES